METGIFLSHAERSCLQSLPDEISHEDVVEFFTLSDEDLAVTNRRGRAKLDRLGFALTLCALRYLGHVPVNLTDMPDHVLILEGQSYRNPTNIRTRGPNPNKEPKS